MHVTVYQSRKHDMRSRVYNLAAVIVFLYLFSGGYLYDLSAVYSDGLVFLISYSVALHRVHMMRMYDHIYFFHFSLRHAFTERYKGAEV